MKRSEESIKARIAQGKKSEKKVWFRSTADDINCKKIVICNWDELLEKSNKKI